MATRKIYLVDTENVGTAWKELLELGDKNRILLFYTAKSPYISYPDLDFIRKYSNAFEMIECYPGKNGLDFQMVSYLGYLLKSAPKSEYILFTNDNGFDAVVKFWSDRNIRITRMSITRIHNEYLERHKAPEAEPEVYLPTAPQRCEAMEKAMEVIKERLSEELKSDDTIPEKVADFLEKCSVFSLQNIHQTLIKTFGTDKGAKIYRSLKSQFRRLYSFFHTEEPDKVKTNPPAPDADVPESYSCT